MIKIKYIKVLLILVLTIHPALIYGNNYLRVKFSTDADKISYRNSYLAYALRYSFGERMILNLNLKKLSNEDGYYPKGYFGDSNWGLYERGTYSIQFNKVFGFDKIILGNYMPHFGQGILFGGVYSLFIYNPYYDLGSFRDDISVSRTYSKASVLEGLAIVYDFGKIKIRPFLSWNSFDCSFGESNYYKYNDNDYDGIPNNKDDDDFTNIKGNFLNNYSCKYSLEKAINDEETYSSDEYKKRRNGLKEYVLGINSSFNTDRYTTGLTFLYSAFNRMIDPYYSFDSNSGDKTAFYFRGKDYIAGEAYLKFNGRIQFFTDIAGTYYKSLSYNEEFSGKIIKSFGFSSGIRTKINKVSVILWAGYVPANLINPHAIEFPWGRRNYASMVASMGFLSDRANFTNWFEVSKELFDIDDPENGEEIDFSYNYNFIYGISYNTNFEIRQKYRSIDNYYYFPGYRTYKIITKINVKHEFSEHIRLAGILEYRFGVVESSSSVGGIGGGMRIAINKNNNQFKGMIFGYITDNSVLASLYPYEPSVYRWSFLPSSLNGKGILISTSFTRDLSDNFTIGFKVRYNIDVLKLNHNRLDFYLDTEMRFK